MIDQNAQTSSNLHAVSLQGEAENRGVYLLGIELRQPCELVFGRHKQGALIDVPAGKYLYIGSAHGQKGSSTLPARLLRHTCRSETKPAHAIQPRLYQELTDAGLTAKIPPRKTVHWHIDYLLDETAAEIFTILAHRTARRIEQTLADTLAAQPETGILSEGLGASDHPGGTHLLQVNASRQWWAALTKFVE